jgi:ferritin
MISQKIQDQVNEQIQAEFQSGWLYLALAGQFEEKNLDGFAHWMKMQWKEEQEHAMKFYDHLVNRDGKVELYALEKPRVEGDNVAEIFESVLKHEQYITKRINKLYDLAGEENDNPLRVLLQWFIDEQVEEEANALNILEKIKMVGEDGTSLYLLDRELGQRVG